jgi:hypothetical protein
MLPFGFQLRLLPIKNKPSTVTKPPLTAEEERVVRERPLVPAEEMPLLRKKPSDSGTWLYLYCFFFSFFHSNPLPQLELERIGHGCDESPAGFGLFDISGADNLCSVHCKFSTHNVSGLL